MLVSLKWLNKYVNIEGIDPHILAEKITGAGIEVESVYRLSDATNCVVGQVISLEPHSDADKLNVCQVQLGQDEVEQIVCGAPNVRAGQKVVVAKVGATLPGNFKIKKAKLRGVNSNGMICSLKELGVENKFVPEAFQNGIYVLNQDAPVGEDAVAFLGLDDTILELSLTPNRSDCLSMLGVAYEVAAILDQEVKLPPGDQMPFVLDEDFQVSIESNDCTLYMAKRVQNVKVGPSPLWLQRALMASNIRPINNVVDITNYVMLELGQPLHAFDYKKLNSQEIVVRNARDGETIVTLDDQERKLISSDLVITDGKNPIALAGVMGGESTEIDSNSTDVLLESAVFAPLTVRKTYTRLGLRSESSVRFEKKVDEERVLYALNRAALFMQELASGEINQKVSVCDHLEPNERLIKISLEKINKVLGMNLKESEVSDLFRRLQFEFVVLGGTFVVTIPSRRADLTIEEDLIEEVIRLYGYNHLGMTLPITKNIGGLTKRQKHNRSVKQVLQALGLTEVMTYSLTASKNINRFTLNDSKTKSIQLLMPMSEDREYMRISLVQSLLDVIRYNNARNISDVHIFELSKTYYFEDETPKERLLLAGALTGSIPQSKWQKKIETVDFYYLKGIIEGIFEQLNVIDKIKFIPADATLSEDYHQGRTAYITLNDRRIGVVGQVHPNVLNEMDLKETYVFEIELDKVYQIDMEETYYKTISKFPQMTRDMAIVVDQKVITADLIDEIKSNGSSILKSVDLFDVYQGEHVESGKKSMAFSLVFERVDRTLTDEEVSKVFNKITNELERRFNAQLRK